MINLDSDANDWELTYRLLRNRLHEGRHILATSNLYGLSYVTFIGPS